MAGQSFRQKRRRLDKKLIEKTENDRQVAKNWYHIRQELTELSMWITLWKLGISLAAQGGFDKNMGKKMWKSR